MCIFGDLNIVPIDIDIHEIKGRHNKAGCTEEERKNYFKMIKCLNLTNALRHIHPKKRVYDYFSYFGSAK